MYHPEEAPAKPFPFELIAERLHSVETEVLRQADMFEPSVKGYFSYMCETSGKRIRPALAILTGEATGHPNPEHLRLGVILELIHMASLVHDDIIDGADTRRANLTANAKWGNSLSVLLGDALFAHAMTQSTAFDDMQICRRIGEASRDVCIGEILQSQRRFDLNLSKEEYFRIIEMKTAALFTAATELAARLSDSSDEIIHNMAAYGKCLGTAYQIYDDCIDLVGKESDIGKTLGTDLNKGKLTLPILNLIESASPAQRNKLNKLLLQDEPIDSNVLATIADYEGALERSILTGQELLNDARTHLLVLPSNPYSAAMEQTTRYLDGLLAQCAS